HRRQNGRVEIDGDRARGTLLCRAAAPVRPPVGPILLRVGTGRAQRFAPDRKSFSPVKYRALACDYDGTLAHDGVVTPSTAAAVDRFRASGRHLFMVTGRELPELKQVCHYLDRFEWVVAENGALLHRPATPRTRLLCEPASPALV